MKDTAETEDESLQDDDVEAIDRLKSTYQDLRKELSKIIVGQDAVIEQLAISLFARGHSLLMGVPGLAKTLLVSRLAETMSLTFSRIQFTPDLMPMDITGTEILQDDGGGKRSFEFSKGPVFANIVLADEINRAPSKTQAAMLEAMQERRITIAGISHELKPPFFVLATQNPIEQEGTYPLPEAQLDRFMFMIGVDYPSRDEELEIARTTTGGDFPKLATHSRWARGDRFPEPGSTHARSGTHLPVCGGPGSPDPAGIGAMHRSGSSLSSAGVPVHAPCSISSSGHGPGPPSREATWFARRMSSRWPNPSCATVSSRPSPRNRRELPRGR